MRRFYRTTYIDGTGEWLIPDLEAGEDLPSAMHNLIVQSAGADGAYDLYGDSRAPRAPTNVDLDFIVSGVTDDAPSVQAAIAAMYDGLGDGPQAGGRRKLWSREADGTLPRWVYAKLDTLALPKERKHILHVPASASLLLPDPTFYDPITAAWLTAQTLTPETVSGSLVGEPIAPDLDFARFDISSSPHNFTLTNDGPLTTRLLIFRMESQGVAGFTNPQITNNTTGQSFSSSTDGDTAATVLSVNCSAGLGRARVSANDGAAWTDDTLNLALGANQAVLMELLPGDNDMTFESGGTPDVHLLCWWAHAWRD